MKVEELGLAGVYLFHGERHPDERGSFMRNVDFALYPTLGLDPTVAQASTAHNRRRGTIRGLHYQEAPRGESKTLWCLSGNIYDVLVDLREGSASYGTWTAVELSAQDSSSLHIPPGIAHGYQTTSDNTSLVYLISTPHVASSARTIHWQDPDLDISWPLDVTSISQRDSEAPPWRATRSHTWEQR